MSSERPGPVNVGLSQVDNAVLALLRQARSGRDQEILSAATAALVPDALAEKQTTMEAILGREALALSGRIRFLGKHPYRPSFLGGSEVKMKKISKKDSTYDDRGRKMDVVMTPLLLTTEPEHVEGTAVYDGFVFIAPIHPVRPDSPTLFIEHRVIDGFSRMEQVANRYVVIVSNTGDQSPVVNITGNEFVEYWHQVYSQRVDDYDDFIRTYPIFNPMQQDYDPTYAPTELKEQFHVINELTRFDSKVDYPDQLYQFPLGLILQAQKLLAK